MLNNNHGRSHHSADEDHLFDLDKDSPPSNGAVNYRGDDALHGADSTDGEDQELEFEFPPRSHSGHEARARHSQYRAQIIPRLKAELRELNLERNQCRRKVREAEKLLDKARSYFGVVGVDTASLMEIGAAPGEIPVRMLPYGPRINDLAAKVAKIPLMIVCGGTGAASIGNLFRFVDIWHPMRHPTGLAISIALGAGIALAVTTLLGLMGDTTGFCIATGRPKNEILFKQTRFAAVALVFAGSLTALDSNVVLSAMRLSAAMDPNNQPSVPLAVLTAMTLSGAYVATTAFSAVASGYNKVAPAVTKALDALNELNRARNELADVEARIRDLEAAYEDALSH